MAGTLLDATLLLSRQHQPIAALLPPEILDCIFEHLDFDYSLKASAQDRLERIRNLSNMSVVAEGWIGQARRLLCRSVEIGRWEQLEGGVPEWARSGLQNLSVDESCWESESPESSANAFFGTIKSTPNLRRLALHYPGFTSLNDTDSKLMRTTQLLPHLVNLSIVDNLVPHSLIFDLLATSGRKIRRLTLTIWAGEHDHGIVPADERLDFGGNLRYLCIRGAASSPHVFRPIWSSLGGLKEVVWYRVDREWRNRALELLQTVAPSLEKLTIDDGDIDPIIPWLPRLPLLTHLSIPSPPTLLPSFLLPPRVISLQFLSDRYTRPFSNRSSLTPALLPASLQQINIKFVHYHQTFERLPPLAKFGTKYGWQLETLLSQLSPRSLRFTTLEVYFCEADLNKIAAVQAECARLGVGFSRRLEKWEF